MGHSKITGENVTVFLSTRSRMNRLSLAGTDKSPIVLNLLIAPISSELPPLDHALRMRARALLSASALIELASQLRRPRLTAVTSCFHAANASHMTPSATVSFRH